MDEPRNLEDFRLSQYLIPYLILPTIGPTEKVEVSFNYYADHAFYSTLQDLSDLETQTTFVNNGRRSIISISLWFLTLESFVNCLCKICCLKQGTDFRKYSGKLISARLDYVFEQFNIDKLSIQKSGLISKIKDFQEFRNDIFHDRNAGTPKKWKICNFSPIPFYNNQVDIFQSLLVFLEVACGLRYCLRELDLMPNISIGNSDVFFFERMDKMYSSVLRPTFEGILKKQNLKTALDLNIDHFNQPLPNSNEYFKRGEVLVVSQIAQDDEFKHPLNATPTKIGQDLYNALVKSYNKPPGFTGSPNFLIDWDKLYKDAQTGQL